MTQNKRNTRQPGGLNARVRPLPASEAHPLPDQCEGGSNNTWPRHWMRALVDGLLAALALLALGFLRPSLALASPPPSPTVKAVGAVGVARQLQNRLVLLNPLALPPSRIQTINVPAASSPIWPASIDPAGLLRSLHLSLPPVLLPAIAPAAAAALRPFNQAGLASNATAPNRRFHYRSSSRLAAHPAGPAATLPTGTPLRPLGTPIALHLVAHHSLLVQSPVPLTRVSLTDSSIAQALVVSPNQVLVQGIAPGEVSLLLWDANSDARAYTVQVGLDPSPLQQELDRLFPNSGVRVTASGDALVVAGTLRNAASAKQVLSVADGFSPHIVNDLDVDASADPDQVMLQVRFAEVDRSAVAQFGANLLSTGAGKTVGSIGTQEFGAPAGAVTNSATLIPPGGSVLNGSGQGAGNHFGLNNLLNVFLFRSDANIGATLQALEQRNLLQILAEPNLVAMDGKEASFLAGGEFPFPVVQGQGAINNVTIQFKPFGVNLHFKPTILPDGTIDLQVAPEVSALDFSNALTVSGFLIPALSTRKASTELELRDGQSFVIAGLLDNRLTTNLSKLPGLGDIPILGKLFQSWNTSKSRNELVVIVTAHLVHPSNHAARGPAMPQPFLNVRQFDGKKKVKR
jgi:pilus assembly protein CpaC